MNAEDNSGGGFAVSVYDEHWQIQLVMDLSGWIIYFQFEYSKCECLGEGVSGDKVWLSRFSPCTFSCLFCFLVFEDSDNLAISNNVSCFFFICDKGTTTAIHVCAQIVGLTASVGVGNAKSIKETIEHICTLCSYLDIQAISTVRENKQDLQRFGNKPETCKHVSFLFSPEMQSTIIKAAIQFLFAQVKLKV